VASKRGPIGPAQYDTEGADDRRDLFGLGDNPQPSVSEFDGSNAPDSGDMAVRIATGEVSSDRKAALR
jgi:hypothetical protein